MINGKSVLAIIPARGGSKEILRKNIREVGGRPLIGWTIEEAKKSRYIDRLILSSDDAEIIGIAKSLGCEAPFVRPASLSQDDTPGIDPVLHALEELPDYDIAILLQATSPLRNVSDIDGCIEYLIDEQANVCVSVTLAQQNPHWMYTLTGNGIIHPLLPNLKTVSRRQDLPEAYILNGAIFIAFRNWLTKHKSFLADETLGYVMPADRSLDIDSNLDLEIMNLRTSTTSHK